MTERKFARTPTDLRLHTSLFGLPCHVRRQSMAHNEAQEEESMVMVKCPLCGSEFPELMHPLHEATDQMVINRLKSRFPEWEPDEGVCEPCLRQ